jgi:hypothetical protein
MLPAYYLTTLSNNAGPCAQVTNLRDRRWVSTTATGAEGAETRASGEDRI